MASNEPRELTPVQKFWDGGKGFKDMSPHVVRVENDPDPTDADLDEEVDEAEEAMTPIPKDSSAQESVRSPTSPGQTEQPVSETTAQSEFPPIPTQVSQQKGADSESGKGSESNEEEPPTPTPPIPSPDSSTPSSSSETSPGKSLPPAVAKPPTSA